MLTSTTENSWNNGFNSARAKLIDKPRELELLKKVYNDPVYYSGYHIRSLSCNLRLTGDVAAEQNHALNTAHYMDGKTWYLM